MIVIALDAVLLVELPHVIKQVISKKIKQTEAADELNISTRQVRRLIKRVKAEGINGIIHSFPVNHVNKSP